MTAENRDELRNALENSERQADGAIAALAHDQTSRVYVEAVHARTLALAALVNLEHLEHSIRASREHEAQGAELLALFRESSVSPGDFGQAMVVLAQIVSYLEDPMGHPSAFELDREDRDTESAARLLGFLEPDPVTAKVARPAVFAGEDAAAIADAEGGFVPGVDFAVGGPMPAGERETPAE